MHKTILIYVFIFLTVTTTYAQQSFDVNISGAGQKVILIPGLTSSGEVWDETVGMLKQNHECHVLTLPGFAGQEAISLANGYLPAVKAEIQAYIQELGEPVILIGHSLGGFLSLQLANENPALIAQAIIVDSYPFYSAAMNPAATEEMMKPMAEQMKTMLNQSSKEDFIQQQIAGLPIMTATAARIPQLENWSMYSDKATVTQALYELMIMDYRDDLSTLKTPILVLGAWYSAKDYGLNAASVKENFMQQYQLAEQVRVEMAPTAHHFIMWDNPEWFMEQIQEFIK